MKYFQAVPLWGRLQIPLRHPQRRLHIQLLGSGGRKYSSSRTQVQNNSLAAPVHIKSKQRYFGLKLFVADIPPHPCCVVCCRHCSTSLLMLFVEVVCCRHFSTPFQLTCLTCSPWPSVANLSLSGHSSSLVVSWTNTFLHGFIMTSSRLTYVEIKYKHNCRAVQKMHRSQAVLHFFT